MVSIFSTLTSNRVGVYALSTIASLVLGIISILTSLFWYIALPTGIIALILGIKTYKNSEIGKKIKRYTFWLGIFYSGKNIYEGYFICF